MQAWSPRKSENIGKLVVIVVHSFQSVVHVWCERGTRLIADNFQAGQSMLDKQANVPQIVLNVVQSFQSVVYV